MNPQKTRPEPGRQQDPGNIESFISDLGIKNKQAVKKAHDAILDLGESATRPLVKALSDPNERVRWEAGRLLDETGVSWANLANAETINALVSDLGSKDGFMRVRARRSLVAIGGKTVAVLIPALASKDQWQRWEAAKTLCQIGDPAAVEALVKALGDDMFDVRWLAAEGLITIGRPSLVPILREVAKSPDILWLREGVHRILHGIIREDIKEIIHPVLKALEGPEPDLELPFAATNALKQLGEK
jgi:HEAT repeat protein